MGDERQQSEMKALFRWLDRNGDGKIDEEEMKAACAALQRRHRRGGGGILEGSPK